MSDYNIFETEEFIRRIDRIPEIDKDFITKKLLQYVYPQLRKEPHYGKNIKKLVDFIPETWHYRIGKYRLFYIIDEGEKTIYMLSADQRKNVY